MSIAQRARTATRRASAQAREQSALLVLPGLHVADDTGEHARRLCNVRSLVQHYTLGAHRHRRIGDLGARRHAGMRQRIEHLGRPDHRQMAGLAEAEDVRHRQPQQIGHAGVEQRRVAHQPILPVDADVAVRQRHALGLAGGAAFSL